ncbi:MAG: hypothetical protein ACON4N_12320 [Myxococcota bacterium]
MIPQTQLAQRLHAAGEWVWWLFRWSSALLGVGVVVFLAVGVLVGGAFAGAGALAWLLMWAALFMVPVSLLVGFGVLRALEAWLARRSG